MSSKIQAQAIKFWQAIVSAETAGAYAKALDVTWTILKEGAILLWLIICLVLVFFDWGYDTATGAGRSVRAWFEGLSQAESTDIASETGKQLVAASKASLSSTISQARTQLGLPDKKGEVAPNTPSSVDSAATPVATVPTSTSTSTPASTSTSSASPSSSSEK
ncbi:MAG: hypothetical protein AAGD25_04125 [Cyanobacteria bacterium P01_F01_bin.150]